MPDDPDQSGSGSTNIYNQNVASINQSGGITAHTVNVSVSSSSKLEIVAESEWLAAPDGVRKDFQAKLVNPGAATKVRLAAYGDGLLGIGFRGEGVMATGRSANGDGWMSHELLTPNSIRGFFIRASKPTDIARLETSFD
jgi:hypothetical protein